MQAIVNIYLLVQKKCSQDC